MEELEIEKQVQMSRHTQHPQKGTLMARMVQKHFPWPLGNREQHAGSKAHGFRGVIPPSAHRHSGSPIIGFTSTD